MRLIIAGTRTATLQQTREAVRSCPWASFATAVISGRARGADTHGETLARASNLPIIPFPADWDRLGNRAGPARNAEMAKVGEGLIAVWDGWSSGTRDMIAKARTAGLRRFVLYTATGKVEDLAAAGELEWLWEEAEERAAIHEHEGGRSRRDAERAAGRSVIAKWVALGARPDTRALDEP